MSETLGSLHTGVHELPAVKELATTDHPNPYLCTLVALCTSLPSSTAMDLPEVSFGN